MIPVCCLWLFKFFSFHFPLHRVALDENINHKFDKLWLSSLTITEKVQSFYVALLRTEGTQQGMFWTETLRMELYCFSTSFNAFKETTWKLIQFEPFGSFSWTFRRQKILMKGVLHLALSPFWKSRILLSLPKQMLLNFVTKVWGDIFLKKTFNSIF